MRSPRLITYALVRDPRLPHLLRSLLADLWHSTSEARRRLVIVTCSEDLCDLQLGDQVEAILVEIRDEADLERLSGACDAAPCATVIAVPSCLLLRPESQVEPVLAGRIEQRARILQSLDEGGLRAVFAA